jgi:ABC-2 type transport system permease protein
MKIIYILWLRQIKRYLRSRSRLIGSLGQPILFLVALGYGFGAIYAKAGGGNYIEFLAPGVICMGILFTAIFAGIEVIWDKQFGFLKETLVAPVSRLQIMVGRTLGGATVATMQGIIVLVITFFVGFRPTDWWMILPAVLFMIVIALFFTALGTAIASRLDDMQGFQVIMNFLVMPIFFLSGALFPLTGLPPVIEWLVRIDPLSYGVDAIRGALVGGSQFGFSLDITVLLVITAFMLGLGTYLFSGIEA